MILLNHKWFCPSFFGQLKFMGTKRSKKCSSRPRMIYLSSLRLPKQSISTYYKYWTMCLTFLQLHGKETSNNEVFHLILPVPEHPYIGSGSTAWRWQPRCWHGSRARARPCSVAARAAELLICIQAILRVRHDRWVPRQGTVLLVLRGHGQAWGEATGPLAEWRLLTNWMHLY